MKLFNNKKMNLNKEINNKNGLVSEIRILGKVTDLTLGGYGNLMEAVRPVRGSICPNN